VEEAKANAELGAVAAVAADVLGLVDAVGGRPSSPCDTLTRLSWCPDSNVPRKTTRQ